MSLAGDPPACVGERLEAHVRSLPDDPESLPQYRAKASMVRLDMEHRAQISLVEDGDDYAVYATRVDEEMTCAQPNLEAGG